LKNLSKGFEALAEIIHSMNLTEEQIILLITRDVVNWSPQKKGYTSNG